MRGRGRGRRVVRDRANVTVRGVLRVKGVARVRGTVRVKVTRVSANALPSIGHADVAKVRGEG